MALKALVSEFNRVVRWLVTAYLGSRLFGRIMILGGAYLNAHAEYVLQSEILEKCLLDKDAAQKFSAACEVARLTLSQWPFFKACEVLSEQTHSCIDFSCMDAFMTILESWPMTIAFSVIVCVIFFTGISRTYNFLQTRSYAAEQRKMERLREMQENSVFLDLPHENTTTVSLEGNTVKYLTPSESINSGARQRHFLNSN